MVKIYPDGKMTQYLATLASGQKLLVSPPYATENLDGYKELVMVAGGSAVTVAIQICEDKLRRDPQDVAVELYLCNHGVEDVLYADVFEEMLKKYPSFRVVHCMSEGDVSAKAGSGKAEWHQ